MAVVTQPPPGSPSETPSASPSGSPSEHPGAADTRARPPEPAEASAPRAGAGRDRAPRVTVTPAWLAAIGVAWVLVTVVGASLVVYGLGPMLEQRDQRHLLDSYRADIQQTANEAFGLPGVEAVTDAPTPGDPVAIVEIDAIRFRQVVVEGVGPQQTRRGPGHVPGTAGPGQPGNSAIVSRRAGFGGPFSQLDELEPGDEIGVITTQGQSVYRVRDVGRRRLPQGAAEIFGPSEDDRLTLVTSGSAAPWSTNPATVVVAELEGRPFEPTPQGGRTGDQDGRERDSSAAAPALLAILGYAAAAAAAVLLYRRTRPRSGYLMSAPLLVVSIVLVAEASARLLPAWF
jgi:sortase A